jgi:hypothetical protein
MINAWFRDTIKWACNNLSKEPDASLLGLDVGNTFLCGVGTLVSNYMA